MFVFLTIYNHFVLYMVHNVKKLYIFSGGGGGAGAGGNFNDPAYHRADITHKQ